MQPHECYKSLSTKNEFVIRKYQTYHKLTFLTIKVHLCITANYAVRVFGDEPDFSMYNFAEKGTTAKVSSGGWALYSEPNYKGKVSYLFPSK